MRAFISAATFSLAVVLLACGESTSPGSGISTDEPTPAPRAARNAAKIVVLGDSISAGLGLAESEAFPAVTEELLRAAGLEVSIVNAGVSGDTSAGGLRRVDWILQQQPDAVVVELGGNDALRGQPLEATEANLREIVRRCRAAGAAVVLVGMDVPTNYGTDYAGDFARLYGRIAADEQVELVPGFMREVGVDLQLMQADGLHPNAEGQRALAHRLVPTLASLVASIAADGDLVGAGRHRSESH